MNFRYPHGDEIKPSIMLLRSLALRLGYIADKTPGGYGGLKLEKDHLTSFLKENLSDARFSERDRDTIQNL